MTIGLLAAKNSPYLPLVLAIIAELDLEAPHIKWYGPQFTEADLKIFSQRLPAGYRLPALVSDPTLFQVIQSDLRWYINCGVKGRVDTHDFEKKGICVVNVHPGRLPFFRGCSAPEWALHWGSPVMLSAHVMGAEFDCGRVLRETVVDHSKCSSYEEFRLTVLENQVLELSSLFALGSSGLESLYQSSTEDTNGRYLCAMNDETLSELKNKLWSSQ